MNVWLALTACCCCPVSSWVCVFLQMTECALSMLTALAEEVHNMDKNRRQEIVTGTSQQWTDIAALAQGFIPEQMAAGELASAQDRCCSCSNAQRVRPAGWRAATAMQSGEATNDSTHVCTGSSLLSVAAACLPCR